MKTIVFALIFISISCLTNGQPGFLDRSFGDTGFVMKPAGFSCYDIKVQPDKKILMSGINAKGLAIVRYLPDGTIDYNFGDSGIANAPVLFSAVKLQISHDGKILAESGSGFEYNIILTRFTAEGKIDSSFGKDGIFVVDFGKIEYPGPIDFQKDGKIILYSTQVTDINNPDPVNFIARFNINGGIDSSFGNNGTAITSSFGGPRSMAVQNDEKILIGGSIITSGGDKGFAIERYYKNGSLDNSFGINGTTITDYSEYDDVPYSIALQSNGKIVAGGYGGLHQIAPYIPGDMLFIRYNTDGNIDKEFGNNGAVEIKFENKNSEIRSVLIDESENNVIGVGTGYGDNSFPEFMLARVRSNGIIDSSFGVNGKQQSYSKENLNVIGGTLQDDKILVAGNNYVYPNNIPVLARYNNGLTQKQILIAKIRRWVQHHNGIVWDNVLSANTYAVQRSNNGVAWSTVHRQQFTANSQRPTANSYADPSPLPGTNYYRLQTTSVDGAVAYSNVIAISSQLSAISLSPNPARSVLRIEGLPANQKIKITIVDLAGNAAMNYEPLAIRPSSINISALKPGNYLLRIEKEGEVVTKQFVKE